MHIRFRAEYSQQYKNVIYRWSDTFVMDLTENKSSTDLQKDLELLVRKSREVRDDIGILIHDIKIIDLTKPYCISWEVEYRK